MTHLVKELTHRESQILALIADGLSNAEIARQLGTSPHTVKNQVHALFVKLGVESRYRAAAMARGHQGGGDELGA